MTHSMTRAPLGLAAVLVLLTAGAPACTRSAKAQPDQRPPAGSSGGDQSRSASTNEPKPGATVSNTPTPASPATVQQAQQVMSHVSAAIQAIRQNDDKRAGQLLETASGTLRTMYEAVPGRNVVSRMDQAQASGQGQQGQTSQPGQTGAQHGTPAASGTASSSERLQLAPLMTEVGAESVYLDPKVVAGVKQAQTQSQSGDQEAANRTLRLAREQMVADIALLPVEDAYSRVVAARAELQAGRRENALQLLQNVPVVVSQVRVSAPLVPARFDLRAAAAAAETGNWQRAEELVGRAEQTLTTAASDPAIGSDLKPLANRAGRIHDQLSSGKKAKPQEIRALAEDIRKRVRSM